MSVIQKIILCIFSFLMTSPFISASSCAISCNECLLNDPSYCTSCKHGLYLNNGFCITSECSNFSSDCDFCTLESCIQCSPGKYISGKGCTSRYRERTKRKIITIFALLVVLMLAALCSGIVYCCRRKKLSEEIIKKEVNNIMQTSPQNVETPNMNPNQGNQGGVPISSNMMTRDGGKNEYNQFANSSAITSNILGVSQLIDNTISVNDVSVQINKGMTESPANSSDSQRKLNEATTRDEKKACVYCGSENVFMKTNCSCFVCYNHSNEIKKYLLGISGEEIKCPIHGGVVSDLKDIEDEIKNNREIPKINNLICEVCKASEGIKTFKNCKCGAKICQQCFEENITLYKYKKCPFCLEKSD